MKKLTLSALAAIAVAGTSFAGPVVVTSKEFKQPCVTPCFRDQEFQLDLFYSFNDAEHQGSSVASDRFTAPPTATPIVPGLTPAGFLPRSTSLLENTNAIPAGSTVVRSRSTSVSLPQYFNDGSGGGVGLNYFFAKYFGVGVEGNWWDGCRGGFDGDTSSRDIVALSAPVDPVAFVAAARAANTSVTFVDASTVILKTNKSFGNTHRSAANQVSGSLILRYPFEGPICWAPYIFGGGGGVFDGKSTGFGHIGLGVEFRVTPNMGFFTDWRWEFMNGDNGDNGISNNSLVREFNATRFVNVDGTTFAVRNLRRVEGNSRNDVSMTRVGVRFAF